MIKINPGWQGGARAGYKSAKGVVTSLSIVVGGNLGCWGILVYNNKNSIYIKNLNLFSKRDLNRKFNQLKSTLFYISLDPYQTK